MRTQEQIDAFLAQHADENGDVPPDILMQAMEGEFEVVEPAEEEQETPTAEDDAKPVEEEPEKQEAATDDGNKDEETPVVLTKDGKHTIPWEEYDGLRGKVTDLTKALEDQATLIEEMKKGKAEIEPDSAEEQAVANALQGLSEEEVELLEEEMPDVLKAFKAQQETIAALKSSVDTLTKDSAEAKKLTEEQAAWAAHFKAITDKHSDFNALMESGKLESWVEKQPSFIQKAFNEGSADDINGVVDMYKATLKPESEDTDKKVDEALAKADKKSTVTSLSQVPGARTSEVDETAAVENMDPLTLAGKMHGKTPAEVMAYLDRVL